MKLFKNIKMGKQWVVLPLMGCYNSWNLNMRAAQPEIINMTHLPWKQLSVGLLFVYLFVCFLPVWQQAGSWTHNQRSWGATAGKLSPQPAWLGPTRCGVPPREGHGTCRCPKRRRLLGCFPQLPLCRENNNNNNKGHHDAREFMTSRVYRAKQSLLMQTAPFSPFLCVLSLMSAIKILRSRSASLDGVRSASGGAA